MQIKKFDTINVVPFIDIMLVLLVIVLTTASFIAKGYIPIELPKSSSALKIDDKKSLKITIKSDESIYFDDKKIDNILLESELLKYKNDMQIEINCDKNTKFDIFVNLLDLLKTHDYKNLGIITEKSR